MWGWLSDATHARLALEAREPVDMASEQQRQQLDGDVSAKLRVVRLIDLAHFAFAKLGGDLIDADPRANHVELRPKRAS